MSLSEKKQEELLAYIAEAKRRGLDPLKKAKTKRTKRFTLGENGYFVSKDGRLYIPTNPQESFIDSPARFSLFYGSRGSGKSGAGSQKALFKIKQGWSGAVYNPDFENMRTSTWPEFREWIDWNMVIPKDRYRGEKDWEPARPFNLNFLNDVVVRVKGIKDPDAARGPNINWLWYDEAQRDETGEAWQIAVASVRVGHHPQAWCTATPAGRDHWMYDFFIEKDLPEEVLDILEELDIDYPMIESFHGTIKQNKDNLDPMFYASMLAAYTDGWLKEQEIGGLFVDRGGVLGDRGWFVGQIVPTMPELKIEKRVRYWDLAASERKRFKGKRGKKGKKHDPDASVGTRMSHVKDDGDKFYIEHQISGRWKYVDLRQKILETAMVDGPAVPIILEEEPGSGGKNQIAAIREWIHSICDDKDIPRFQIEGWRPDNDRVILANVWFAEANKSKVYLVEGEWNELMLNQLASFPIGQHDDRITSITGARMNVAPIKKWSSPEFLSL